MMLHIYVECEKNTEPFNLSIKGKQRRGNRKKIQNGRVSTLWNRRKGTSRKKIPKRRKSRIGTRRIKNGRCINKDCRG